jgi:hypothetical protein
MNRISSYCSVIVALFLLAGCAQTQQRAGVRQVCIADANRAAAMQAGESALGEMLFVIDKADVEHGYISTQPLAGAQFFEFWRSDNVGGRNRAQANLHSIRRTAQLKISGQQEKVCVSCEVKVQRLSLPTQEVSSSVRAYQMFSKSSARMQSLRLRPGQKKHAGWVDLQSDGELAAEILERIEKKMAPRGPAASARSCDEPALGGLGQAGDNQPGKDSESL